MTDEAGDVQTLDPGQERRSGPEVEDSSRRSPEERDRDRVLYSEGFRRLGGVTQVAIGAPEMGFHNRLTHSLKVEQVGKSLVRRLHVEQPETVGAINLAAVETACLGHDLGHPPFGHAGEQELNSLVVCETHQKNENLRTLDQRRRDPCDDCWLEDGFEGNAQTFRVLAVLAVHRVSIELPLGLDLTRRSLAASTKYPWTRGTPSRKPDKWGAYDCDAPILEWVYGSTNSSPGLDAQVMDWADDVSYAVHDIEDFYRVGLLPINDYRQGSEVLEKFVEYCDGKIGTVEADERASLDQLLEFFPKSKFYDRSEDLAGLDGLRAVLLRELLTAASAVDGRLLIQPPWKRLNSIFKQFIWYHIIDETHLANIQTGQQRVLREIFEILRRQVHEAYKTGTNLEPGESELRRLPNPLRRAVEVGRMQEESPYTHRQIMDRAILDFISMLTDAEAYKLHSTLRGREAFGHL